MLLNLAPGCAPIFTLAAFKLVSLVLLKFRNKKSPQNHWEENCQSFLGRKKINKSQTLCLGKKGSYRRRTKAVLMIKALLQLKAVPYAAYHTKQCRNEMSTLLIKRQVLFLHNYQSNRGQYLREIFKLRNGAAIKLCLMTFLGLMTQ